MSRASDKFLAFLQHVFCKEFKTYLVLQTPGIVMPMLVQRFIRNVAVAVLQVVQPLQSGRGGARRGSVRAEHAR